MDPDPPSPSPRKVRFAPKGPPRRSRRLATTEIEEDNGDDSEAQQFLARRVSEHLARREAKVEKKSPVQVAFSHGVASSTIRSFGRQRQRTDDGSERANDGSSAAYSDASTTGEMQNHCTSMSAAETQGVADSTVDLTDATTMKKKKEYREPWDYHNSYYPITLPLRRPHSGNPEVLDKAEFEEALEYDENSLNSASYLGLLDQDDTPRMLVFVFPSNLPIGRQPTNANRRETDDTMKAVEKSVKSGKGKEKGKVMVGSVAQSSGISNGINGKEIAGSSINGMSGYPMKKDISLENLPEGYMGKMLVYKSGAVKLKFGDIMYDVSPGCDCSFPQNVMAINVTDEHCCELGEANKRAIVTPDIDSLLSSQMDSGY